MELVDKVLQRIAVSNLNTNPLKKDWGVTHTDFLGYEMTHTSSKPMKIDALLKMSPPSNRKQVRNCLGAVNFYKYIMPCQTHVLAPLTRLTGQVPFEWTTSCQQAFDKMKAPVLAIDKLNMYADLNKSFPIICNASDYQLGSCIL